MRAARIAVSRLELFSEHVQPQELYEHAIIHSSPTNVFIAVGIFEQQVFGNIRSHIEAAVDARQTSIAAVV